MSTTPPGWYPSPERPGWLQWFDGDLWQQNFQPNAQPVGQGGWGAQQSSQPTQPQQQWGGAYGPRGMGGGMGMYGRGGVMWLPWVMVGISTVLAIVLVLQGDALVGALFGVLAATRFVMMLRYQKRRRQMSDHLRG